jgi:hypothetical protein
MELRRDTVEVTLNGHEGRGGEGTGGRGESKDFTETM